MVFCFEVEEAPFLTDEAEGGRPRAERLSWLWFFVAVVCLPDMLILIVLPSWVSREELMVTIAIEMVTKEQRRRGQSSRNFVVARCQDSVRR